MISHKFDVLDKGYIQLENAMAHDADVLNAAWASTDKHKERDEISDVEYERMLDSLFPETGPVHVAPLRHCVFRFYVKAPLFVVYEWYRHVIGIAYGEQVDTNGNSWSQQSMRASLVKQPEFYEPSSLRRNIGRSTAYTFEEIEDPELLREFLLDLKILHELEMQINKKWLDRGVSRELTQRVFDPYIYQNFVWTVNANALLNFLSLRNESHAQWEIQEYAKRVEDCFKGVMPRTYAQWMKRGRPKV